MGWKDSNWRVSVFRNLLLPDWCRRLPGNTEDGNTEVSDQSHCMKIAIILKYRIEEMF